MNPHELDHVEKECFREVDEPFTTYDDERDDLPLFEAKHMRQDALERALRYAHVLIAKGEFDYIQLLSCT